MENCIFCKIINKELPAEFVYEDADIVAFLDIHPVNPGHTLVVPKKHVTDMRGMDTQTACKLMDVIHRLSPAIIKAVGAEAFNVAVNNGTNAGQVVFHSHFHIMPRFAGDGYALWQGKDMGQEELKEVADDIKNI